jgi:hypothetical protein
VAALAALVVPGRAASDLNVGPQSILVILVTWGPQPVAPAALRTAVFEDANRYVQDVSFGKASLVGDVTPWLPVKEFTNCDPVTISDIGLATLNAAKAGGYDPAKYSRYVFVLPRPPACDFLGFGAGNEVWLFGTASTRIVEHELGHTFGLSHAWSVACATCRPVEYGDPYDVMGHGPGHYNAAEKAAAGWLTTIATASNGVHAIDQLELPTDSPQALVVHTAIDDYWFDHREPLLGDVAFANTPVVQGVLVHASPSPDDRDGVSRFQPGNVLILNPAGSGADAVVPGQTFRVKNVFDLTVLDHAGTHVDLRFTWTDTAKPGRPSVYSPGAVLLRGRKLDIEWGRATETGSGLDRYAISVDGKVRATVVADAPRQIVLARPKKGRHVVSIVAVDRAGNRSRAGTVKFKVR